MEEEGKITLVRFVHEAREKMLAEHPDDAEHIRSNTDGLGAILHDVFCLEADHSDNIAFSVVLTADGEPFVDWKLRTFEEWKTEVFAASGRVAVRAMLRKVFGI